MSRDHSGRAPLRPAIHVAPAVGWINDPNGLCFDGDTWHAFYQHDPETDVHGTMHWGHSSSTDLSHWIDHGVALAPDALGQIYSGSVVVDHDDTAGFGANAMVAVFTHHLDGAQCQSLAFSHDQGMTWEQHGGNPVLESDEPDFRDPKVRRHVRDGDAEWVMSLAVGRRIEFYRSADLQRWELSGTFSGPIGSPGVWECPDLLNLTRPGQPDAWFLAIGVADGGPNGHSGTYVVPGEFDGSSFSPSGAPRLLDQGPDFYAAQSFSGAPDGQCVLMGWMNSWQYASAHPSRGRRGVLSLARRLDAVTDHGSPTIVTTPLPDVASRGDVIGGRDWTSEVGRALHVDASGDLELHIRSGASAIATVSIADGELSLSRHEAVVDGYAQTYRAPLLGGSSHQIVIDHGTLEVFAADGRTNMSALIFPGTEWAVRLDGSGTLTMI